MTVHQTPTPTAHGIGPAALGLDHAHSPQLLQSLLMSGFGFAIIMILGMNQKQPSPELGGA